MERQARTMVWNPNASDTLVGRVRHVAGLITAIETDDDSIWVLDAEAASEVSSLQPEQGQRVKILAEANRERWGDPQSITYAVWVLDEDPVSHDERAEPAMANRYPYTGDLSPMPDWTTDD
jgi:hypothetical protein